MGGHLLFLYGNNPSGIGVAGGVFQQIPAWWSGLWQPVGDFFSNVWTGMMETPVLSGIVDMIRSLWENLSAALQGI